MIELDHVLIAVRDLGVAAARLTEAHGLLVTEGGSHPCWGTANRIVPLGDAYLELIAVVDERTASEAPFGRWVADGASDSGNPIGWAVRPADLDATAQRLGLIPLDGSRLTPGGKLIRWRMAGVEEAVREPSLPFFIEWAPGTVFPGSVPDDKPPSASIIRLDIDGDQTALTTWLGSDSLPLRVSPGHAALRRAVLAGAAGEIVVGERSGPD